MLKKLGSFSPLFAAVIIIAVTVGFLPTNTASAQSVDDCVNEYIVYDGDTLSNIAKGFGVDMNELAALNDISNPSLIYIGDILCLDGLVEAQPAPENGDEETPPEDTPDTTDGVYTAPPPPVTGNANFEITVGGKTYQTDNNGFYTVRRGDNLYRIALAFGLTQERLMAVNGIQSPDRLLAGTRLLIPEPTPLPTSQSVPATFPQIAIVPRVAGPGDMITVHGSHYPAETDIDIYFEKRRENRISDVIETVTTDENGTFEVEIEVISEWTNGDPVDSRTVSVSGYSPDDRFWAMNFFINSAFTR